MRKEVIYHFLILIVPEDRSCWLRLQEIAITRARFSGKWVKIEARLQKADVFQIFAILK